MVFLDSFAQIHLPAPFFEQMAAGAGQFIPSLIGAIAILVVGWLVATLVTFVVKGLLRRLQVDRRVSGLSSSSNTQAPFPLTQWVSTLIFWVIFLFAIVASLNALHLTAVSTPLNAFLDQIFVYLPKVGGALLLLGLGWIVATLVRSLVNTSLGRLNLDQRLNDQAGLSADDNPVVLHETIGNILFWFILLLFVPLVLNALQLPGLLTPIQGLINSFLQAVPRILTAAVILVVGWIIARIVRGVVTNLLVAFGTDQIAPQLGLKSAASGGLSLSGLAGTLAYVLVLIPALISALSTLNIDAISTPAIAMLQQVITTIPQILMAGVVVVVAYFIGQFLANLVTEILRSAGFDNVLGILGLPELSLGNNAPTPTEYGSEEGVPVRRQGPSEIVGIVTLVAIVLFGAVIATEILNFPALTEIVRAILKIGAQVLSGLVVFALGLYLANLAFRLINATGTGQSRVLAQAARVAIIIFSGAMALQQMGVATDIVNLAFGLLLGAIAVAIAIAFGLGGRDVAAEQLREWLSTFRQR
ncbi:MAG: mechanosensitive ion channel [Nodosilinea sp.]